LYISIAFQLLFFSFKPFCLLVKPTICANTMDKESDPDKSLQLEVERLQSEKDELTHKLAQLQHEPSQADGSKEFKYLFENFFNLSLELLAIADVNGKFIRVNKSWENTLGFLTRNIESKTIFDLVHPDDLAETRACFNRILQNTNSKNLVNRLVLSAGGYRHVEWKVMPIGKLLYIAVNDITERVEYSEAIAQSEERFSLVVDASELGIWDWDVVNDRVYYSPRWKMQLGFEDNELANEFKTWQSLLHPDDYDRMHQEVNAFINNPSKYFVSEFRMRHKDGHYVWIHNKATGVLNSNGKMVRFLGAHTDITFSKEAEEYIQMASQTYKGIVNSISEAVYVLDANYKIIEANNAAEKLSGYKLSELTGKTLSHIADTNQIGIDEIDQHLRNAESGKTHQFMLWGKHASGSIYPQEVSVSPSQFFNQPVTIAVARNVEDRMKAEQLLLQKSRQIEAQNEEYKTLNEQLRVAKISIEQSERKYKTLIENSFDGVFLLDRLRFTFVNKRFEEITGYSYKELVLDNLDVNLLLDKRSQAIVKEISEARKAGQALPVRYDVLVIAKDGSEKSVELSTSLVEFSGQQFTMGIMRDVTLRRSMEREINFRSRLQKLLINLSARFINIASSKVDKEINNALAEIGSFSGVDRAYVFSYDFVKGTMSNTYEWCAPTISPVIDTMQEIPLSLIPDWGTEHKVGRAIHIPQVDELPADDSVRQILQEQSVKSLLTIPLMYHAECIGFVGFDAVEEYKNWSDTEKALLRLFAELLVNLQVKARYEESLRMATEKAQESDRLKSAFLSNMSHEIRTPMNAICGFSNLLNDKSINEEQRQSFIEIININSQQLLGIINDIIDISKIESGQITVAKVKFSLNELIRELELVFSQTAKLKRLEFKTHMGLSDKDSMVESDDMKIRQVLNNLLFNALKFTEEGSIEFGYNLKDNYLEFFVADSGIGIPADKFNVIFERFQQVENVTTQSRKGTGLGLPISRAFAELLGGKIWLTSEVEKGSTFYFTIPYHPAENGHSHKELAKDGTFELSSYVILIAEDDEPNYLYLKELIKGTGAKILRAKNGREAVDICLNHKVDVVLMDIKMPVMDGVQATQELRAQGVNIPIIAQTAYALSEDRARLSSVGCNYYITKPIDQVELFGALHQMLNI